MIRWLDGFDSKNSSFGLSNNFIYQYYWNNGFLQGHSYPGRYGGKSLEFMNTAFDEAVLSKVFESRSSWTVGFDLTWTGAVVSNVPFLVFYDSNISHSNAQVGLQFNSSGILQLVRGPISSQTVLATGTTVFLGGTSNFKYVEVQVSFANSGGTYEVRVDDVLEFSGVGDTQVTANASANIISLRWNSFGIYGICWDNYYIVDNQGSSNNTFLGPIRIDTYWPASNNSVSFTPYSGTNYQMVDDSDHTNFTPESNDYNTPNAVNNVDIYNIESIGNNGTILGVSEFVWAFRGPGISYGLKPVSYISGTYYTGNTFYPLPINGNGYGPYTTEVQSTNYILEKNPNTNGSWTPTDLNNTKFGYKAV